MIKIINDCCRPKINNYLNSDKIFPGISAFANIGGYTEEKESNIIDFLMKHKIENLHCSGSVAEKLIYSKNWFKGYLEYERETNTIHSNISGLGLTILQDLTLDSYAKYELDNNDRDYLRDDYIMIEKNGQLYPFITGMKF